MKSFAHPFLIVALAMAGHTQAFADDQGAKNNATPAEELRAAIEYLSQLPRFTVDLTMDFQLMDQAGTNQGVTLFGALAMAEDGRVRFKVVTPEDTMELYANGEKTMIYLAAQNKFVDGGPAVSRRNALTQIPAGPFRGAQMLFSDLMHGDEDFYDVLGQATVERHAADAPDATPRIHLDAKTLQCDFWVREGETPLLERFSLDLTRRAAANNPQVKSAAIVYTFENWDLSPDFAEGHFAFKLPEGATELTPTEPPADPMVGTVAPDIKLPLLDGGTLDLAEHKDKHVVILDFWASWCGPCRIGLPIVTGVAKRHHDKGVRVYAVNVGEDQRTVQAFLEQLEIDAPIALDTERVAQRDYGANSIPKTVVIGRDGIIRDVHNGVSPTLEEDLETLLAELTE